MDDCFSFVQNVFSPFVAICASDDVEEICAKNGLSFSELLQPFSDNIEVPLKDFSGGTFPVKIKINFRDLATQYPQGPLAKKQLSEAVFRNQPDVDFIGVREKKTHVVQGNYEFDVCMETPWYYAYRDAFFRTLPPHEHDFTRHFLACIFVVSSTHRAPQQQLQQLIQHVDQLQLNLSHHSKWFFNNVVYYYVLLRDASSADTTATDATFLSLKNLYGSSSCYLLTINSVSPTNLPTLVDSDIWSPILDMLYTPLNGTSNHLNGAHNFYHKLTSSAFKVQHGNLDIDNGSAVSIDTISAPLMFDGEHPLASEGPPTPTTPTEPSTRPRGQWLTSSDRENVKTFVSSFASLCLAPFVDQQLRSLSDQVANKKGLHRSFANAAKNFFGSRGKANLLLAGANHSSATNSVVYSQQSPELLVRKLGDLAFLFHQYDTAYNAYHTAKRDFQGDQAWLYCAGAEEMAALSIFMLGKDSPRSFPTHYFEQAINTYLNVCKLPQQAMRAVLLHAECLRSLGEYDTLAAQFLYLVSSSCSPDGHMGSDWSELRAALLLEQAAHCHLRSKPVAQLRKFAFELVLAGHRYSKAGARRHSLHAYREAAQLLRGRSWTLAQDHISFMIGRQCAALGRLDAAFDAYHELLADLSSRTTISTAAFYSTLNVGACATAQQQTLFIKEYLSTIKALDKQEFEMPIPNIDMSSIRILLGQPRRRSIRKDNAVVPDSATYREIWSKLEDCCFLKASGLKVLPFDYRNTVDIMDSSTLNSQSPFSVQNEPIFVEFKLTNPLQIALSFYQMHLSWVFHPSKAENHVCNTSSMSLNQTTDQDNDVVETCPLDCVNLEPMQSASVKLSVIPKQEGRLNIRGIFYQIVLPSLSSCDSNNSLSSSTIDTPSGLSPLTPLSDYQGSPVWGYQALKVRGPKEKNPKKVKNNEWYAKDFRLQPIVVPSKPCLKVEFDTFPSQMLCGEVQRLNLSLLNDAPRGLTKLHISSYGPKEIAFAPKSARSMPPNHAIYKEMSSKSAEESFHCRPVPAEFIDTQYVTTIPGVESMEARESVSVPVWIRGPDVPGEHEFLFLFYYESDNNSQPSSDAGTQALRHRVTKFCAKVTTISSLVVHAAADVSLRADNIGSLVLSVHAKNSSEMEGANSVDLSLLQVSIMSSRFFVTSQIGGSACTPSHAVVTTIRPRETKDIALKLCATKPYPQHHFELSLARNQDTKFQDNLEDHREICDYLPNHELLLNHKDQFPFSTRLFSQWPLSIVKVETSCTPCANFMMADATKLGELKDENVPPTTKEILDMEVAKLKGTENANEVTQEDALDVTVAIIWKAAVEREGLMQVVMGQHQVTLRDYRVMYSSAPNNRQAISTTNLRKSEANAYIITRDRQTVTPHVVVAALTHPDYVQHDFGTQPALSVNISLVLHNPSQKSSIPVTVACIDHMRNNSNDTTPLPYRLQTPSSADLLTADDIGGFTWTGKTRFLLTLPPMHTESLSMKAMFLSTGTFNISSALQITVSRGETLSSFSPQQSLIVIDSPQSV